MTDLNTLPALAKDGLVHVVIETPQGAQAKYKYDLALQCFVLSRQLAAGLRYPYAFGFVPSTMAADGDPLDAMVIGGLETFAGLVLRCRPVGVLQVAQTEKGKTVRNDRVFVVPHDAPVEEGTRLLADRNWRRQLEAFFVASIQGTGKQVKFVGWRNAAAARRTIDSAIG